MRKLAFILMIAVVAVSSFVSCTDENSVSGVAVYSCRYVLVNSSSVTSSQDTLLKKLNDALVSDIKSLQRKHSHSWDYQYEGSSVDEALSAQDKIALSYYDDAVKDMNELKASFDSLANGFDWGRGSFTYTYKYKISRLDKTLAESEDLTFTYRRH